MLLHSDYSLYCTVRITAFMVSLVNRKISIIKMEIKYQVLGTYLNSDLAGFINVIFLIYMAQSLGNFSLLNLINQALLTR